MGDAQVDCSSRVTVHRTVTMSAAARETRGTRGGYVLLAWRVVLRRLPVARSSSPLHQGLGATVVRAPLCWEPRISGTSALQRLVLANSSQHQSTGSQQRRLQAAAATTCGDRGQQQ